MEANIESYLSEKGVEYEKITKINDDEINNFYVLERFIEFDGNFDFTTVIFEKDKYRLLGKDKRVNDFLNELSENNIKHKEVLMVINNTIHFSIQYEIEDIKFRTYYLNYKYTIEEYEFRKFIKYNTTFEYCGFDAIILISTDKLGFIEIFIRYGKIVIRSNRDEIEFTQFQEFKEWLAENMPEYLRSEDIKIALKD
jgi:hypothetical protein